MDLKRCTSDFLQVLLVSTAFDAALGQHPFSVVLVCMFQRKKVL